MLNIGELRHRVIIETPTNTVTAMGDHTKAWATHATVWARIRDIYASEPVVANRSESHITSQVKIRHLSTVTPAMRINDSDKGRYLYIKAVKSDPTDKEFMLLDCGETE